MLAENNNEINLLAENKNRIFSRVLLVTQGYIRAAAAFTNLLAENKNRIFSRVLVVTHPRLH